jgi:hypothetical protein
MTKFADFAFRTIASLLIMITLTLLLHETTDKTEGKNHHIYALNETSPTDFNFAAAGDWNCTPDAKNTVNNIIDKNPELVLGLGDYSYQNNADCWLQLIDPIADKMKIVLGNHDHLIYTNTTNYYFSPELLQQYMNHFNLSSQYYSFNYKDVHFIAMSTEVPYENGSKQYNFVKSDLQATVSKPNINWIVVFYHRFAYTSATLPDSIPELRNTYHPLFGKYGVDLVIQAHSHNYQRSYPIKFNDQDSRNPFIVNNETTNYYNPEGQIYTIVGTGGAPDIHNFTRPPTPYTAVQFNAYGFLNIDILHNGSMLEGKFYENNGTIKDHFTIVKLNNDKEKTDSSPLSSSNSSPFSPRSSSSEPRPNKGYDDH